MRAPLMLPMCLAVTVLGTASVTLAADPGVTVRETAVLRLEVEVSPYRYRLIEKATGEVLLSLAETTVYIGAPPTPISGPAATPVDAGGAPAPRDAAATGAAAIIIGIDAAGPFPADDARDAGAAAAPDAGPPDAPAAAPVARRVLRAALAPSTAGGPASALQADLVLDGDPIPGQVTFSFPSPEVLDVQLSFAPGAIGRVSESFDDRQERVYGIWEYPWDGKLDNRGVDRPYLGVGQLPGTNFTSGRAPFYVTSRRYGVYARSDAAGQYTIAVGGRTGFGFDEPRLRYAVIYGPHYLDVLRRYTELAGAPFMPPLWAFGSIWWEDDFHADLRAVATAQGKVLDVAAKLQEHRIPASGLLIDRPFGTGLQGWGNFDFDPSFPDPAGMTRMVRERGMELMLWVANRAWNRFYDEGLAQDFLFPGLPEKGPAADLRKPLARAWLTGALAIFPRLGVKAYKIDRGEEGEQPAAVQNQNSTLFAELARDGLVAQHGAESFLISRNVHDHGRRHTALWSGDPQASFEGLAYSVAAGVRSGAIVMPMWGSDAGGYLRSPTRPDDELFARWLAFAAWSPLMEVLIGGGHTPWYDHAPALVAIARRQAATHHDLIPYTRSFMHAATRTGAPVIRPLIFAYPDDPALADRADQYLYGSELLVAPVLTAGATSREVYLPAGRWLDYQSRAQVMRGGRTAVLPAPMDSIPVLVREGAIVPRGDVLRANNNWTPGWSPNLRVEFFPGQGAIDNRFDYFTGTRVEAITASSDGAGRVAISFGELGAPGRLEIAVHGFSRVVWADGTPLAVGTAYTFDRVARVLSIPFRGPTGLVIEGAVSVFAADGDAGVTDGPASPGGGCSCAVGSGPARDGGAAWLLVGAGLAALVGRRRQRASKRW